MERNVVLVFDTFEERDRWLRERPANRAERVRMVYSRSPRLAVRLPDDEVCELKQRAHVELFPDAQMAPL